MKIKINKEIKGVDGINSIINSDTKKALTLKDVCINAVLMPMQEDDWKKKFEKWEIFKKLRDAKEEVDLSVEQISIIKNAVGKFQPPLIMGQVFEMIEKI